MLALIEGQNFDTDVLVGIARALYCLGIDIMFLYLKRNAQG
jgi:hypothetical protein